MQAFQNLPLLYLGEERQMLINVLPRDISATAGLELQTKHTGIINFLQNKYAELLIHVLVENICVNKENGLYANIVHVDYFCSIIKYMGPHPNYRPSVNLPTVLLTFVN